MDNNKRPTQCQRLLVYMRNNGSVTQLDALSDLGVLRLASRISELRKNGHKIGSKQVAVTNRWGEKAHVKSYYLLKEDEEAVV